MRARNCGLGIDKRLFASASSGRSNDAIAASPGSVSQYCSVRSFSGSGPTAVAGCRYRRLLAIFHETVEPVDHFGLRVQNGFSRPVAMRFVWQHHQPHVAAIDRLVHTTRLHGKGAAVVVVFAMDQQNRFLDLVGVHE